MAVELVVSGYQGIEKASILVEGFTVLMGPTHSGKSAFHRAIQDALYNDVHPEEIKEHASGCRVEIRREGHEWIYTRHRTARLIFDKEPYQKLNRQPPLEPLLSFGFPEVKVEDKKLRPHFHNQLDALFGTSLSPSLRFSLMMSISECDRLPDVRKDVEFDLKQANRDKDITEGVVKSLGDSASRYEWQLEQYSSEEFHKLESALSKVKKFYEIKSEVDNIVQWSEQLEFANHCIISLERLLTDYSRYESARQKYDQTMDLSDTVALLSHKVISITVMETVAVDLLNQFDTYVTALEKVTAVKKQIGDYEDAKRDVASNELLIAAAEEQLRQVSGEIAAINMCPLCGAPIKDGVYSHEHPGIIESKETTA